MLNELHIQAFKLYAAYKLRDITLIEYLELLRPIDSKIDSLEISELKCYLLDSPVFERSFLKQLHL